MAEDKPQIRSLCPFYGFRLSADWRQLVERDGNECALETRTHCKCKMACAPNWGECSKSQDAYNTMLVDILKIGSVSFPHGISSGIPLTVFMLRMGGSVVSCG